MNLKILKNPKELKEEYLNTFPNKKNKLPEIFYLKIIKTFKNQENIQIFKQKKIQFKIINKYLL